MKKVVVIIFVFIVLAIISLFIGYSVLSQPVDKNNTSSQSFVVNQGDGLMAIARRLAANGLIKNESVFVVRSYFMGLSRSLQAGVFQLSPNLSVDQVVVKLASGGNFDRWLKITEGWRNEEIAAYMKTNKFFDSSAFLVEAKTKQGYLFPDSYLIASTANLSDFFTTVSKNFADKLAQAKSGSTTTLSDTDAVILASLIEREGRTLETKKMVAGVLMNRLAAGMPLQVDATAQYVRDSQLPHPSTYWLPASKSDLSIVSVYNTYLNVGLPPTAICNPGLNALIAAFHPTSSDYLFYITGNDNQMHYAKTLDDHNANIAKYLK